MLKKIFPSLAIFKFKNLHQKINKFTQNNIEQYKSQNNQALS